jgi:hypothetical protein
MMKLWSSMTYAVIYIYEAVMRIFSPSHDDYPEIGESSFNGDIYRAKWVE